MRINWGRPPTRVATTGVPQANASRHTAGIDSLSDGSATAFSDTTLQNASGITNAVYTIAFQAASPGQTLTVSFTMQNSLATGGYVSLQSATLA